MNVILCNVNLLSKTFKTVFSFFLELFGIVMLLIIASVFLTGAWKCSFGPLSIQTHDVVIPVLLLVCALGLRRWLAGSFLHGWKVQRWSAHLVRLIAGSATIRAAVIIGGVGWLICILLLLRIVPLENGLQAQYYSNTDWQGAPALELFEQRIDLDFVSQHSLPVSRPFSVLWSGALFVPRTDKYTFSTVSDDGSELFINGQRVVDNSGLHGVVEQTGTIELKKGFHEISIRYMQGGGGAFFSASWGRAGRARQPLVSACLFPETPQNMSAFQAVRLKEAVLPALLTIGSAFLLLLIVGGFSWQISRNPAAWTIRPFYKKLLVFLILATLGVNIVLSLVGSRFSVEDSTFWMNTSSFQNNTALYYTHFFLSSPMHQYGDSWKHMYDALQYFEDPQQQSRYSELFFEKHVKFIYPPTSLLLFKPFSRFSVQYVITRANLISWLAILFSAVLLAKIFSKSVKKYAHDTLTLGEQWCIRVLSLCVTLSFYPIMRSFRLGQAQTWLYVLFVTAMWLWLEERKVLSGGAIGLICLVKPQLGLLAFWGLFRKQWHFAAAIFLTSGVVGLLSLAVFGWQNHVDYLQVLSYISKHGESFHPNQSINGLLNRFFFNGTNLTWDPYWYPPYHRFIHLATTTSSALLILFVLFWKRKLFRNEEILDLSIASLSFTMASPLAWEHHYSFLLPMFAYVLPLTLASRCKKTGLWLLGIAFVLVANYYQFTGLFAATHFNIIQSYVLFGALVVLFYLYRLKNSNFLLDGCEY
ncbi:hypothetical protein CSA56_01440 [candidate division KSB3 bacterium]|uniref:PA14 domain-containing protein n=1 Tax=candidate division KSB3 bacterium TaxID=2044937 RepID=A0A2G6KKC4_9BACT|nr:MAG: hypothetical protein CSA56_01440 [candidate division KSB3 bacterium]